MGTGVIARVVCAAVLVCTLVGCSGDDDDASPPTSAPSQLAQAFLDNLAIDIPSDQAECAVDGMLDALGADGVAALQGATPPSADAIDALAAVMDDCVPAETVEDLVAAELATTEDPELAACVAAELRGELTMGDLLRIGLLSRADPQHPDLAGYQDLIVAATDRCVTGAPAARTALHF